MRKTIIIFIMLLNIMIWCTPATADSEYAAVLETDLEVFSIIVQVANWEIQDGYEMKGYLRTDLNGDSVVDAIVLLEDTADQKCVIAIIMSEQNGYQVTQNEQAMPFGAIDADVFAGINAGADFIALYTRDESGEYFENEYLLSREGSQFSLSKITSVQWTPETNDATQNTLDFSSGQYIQKSGTIQSEGFLATSEERYELPESTRQESFSSYTEPAKFEGLSTGAGLEIADDRTGNDANNQPTETDGIYCNACEQSFATGEAFRNHQCATQVAVEAGSFVCTACGNHFDTHDALVNHSCAASVNEVITCDICGQTFSNSESYHNHICISYLDDNSVYCDICGGWYAEGEAFRSHLCVP